MSVTGVDEFSDLPERIQRRMSTPFTSTSTVADIRRAAFEALEVYRAMVLDASRNECVLPSEALAIAARAGKGPLELVADLEVAQRAYLAWRFSVDP
jgi:hypothetical protein